MIKYLELPINKLKTRSSVIAWLPGIFTLIHSNERFDIVSDKPKSAIHREVQKSHSEAAKKAQLINKKTTSDIVLEVHDITLSFGGVQAIEGVSFSIKAGEICGIIGPNGAGKSSLLNVINGVYQASKGTVSFQKHQFKRIQPLRAAKLGIGRTFQHNALFKGLSVIENILAGLTRHSKTSFIEHTFGLWRYQKEKLDFHRRAAHIIKFLELESYQNTIVSTLPYGVQKRVDLARALVSSPLLLLLDEPMAGMNQEEKRELSHFIRETNRVWGTTVVLIEHDIGVVMDLCNHVVVLDNGKKIADGEPDEVRNNQSVINAYLGVSRDQHTSQKFVKGVDV